MGGADELAKAFLPASLRCGQSSNFALLLASCMANARQVGNLQSPQFFLGRCLKISIAVAIDTPPPPLEAGSPYDLSRDPRYAGIAIPATESLKDTIARVLPYYDSAIAPQLRDGRTVLISAHGNSLRALVKHLSGISDADITGLEIPTGQPIVYDLNDDLTARERYYLSER